MKAKHELQLAVELETLGLRIGVVHRSSVPESPYMHQLLGAYLLCLLAQNRIAEFHTVCKLLKMCIQENRRTSKNEQSLKEEEGGGERNGKGED